MIWLSTVIPMTHKARCNLYIASCDSQGGIYQYRLSEGMPPQKIGFTPMDRPMYMTVADQKMYTLLRAPFENGESGLAIHDMNGEGMLENPAEAVSTKGEVACHLAVDSGAVYVVNYISGSIARLPGRLAIHSGRSVHPTRQSSAHTHFVAVTPDQKYVCVTDLGMDKIFLYHKDLTLMNTVELPLGHGARHLAFHGSGRYVFCANELASTVSMLKYHDGEMELLETVSVLPCDYDGESTVAAIRCEGNTVYVSNRGHDSVSVLELTEEGLLLKGHIPTFGKSPRDFWISGDLLITANELSDQVALISLSKKSMIERIDVKRPVFVIVHTEGEA